MLVLTRRPGERIVILPAGITITINSIVDNKVRVALEAPASQTILREELLDDDVVKRKYRTAEDRKRLRGAG